MRGGGHAGRRKTDIPPGMFRAGGAPCAGTARPRLPRPPPVIGSVRRRPSAGAIQRCAPVPICAVDPHYAPVPGRPRPAPPSKTRRRPKTRVRDGLERALPGA